MRFAIVMCVAFPRTSDVNLMYICTYQHCNVFVIPVHTTHVSDATSDS